MAACEPGADLERASGTSRSPTPLRQAPLSKLRDLHSTVRCNCVARPKVDHRSRLHTRSEASRPSRVEPISSSLGLAVVAFGITVAGH